jgi:hypothetical protein
VANGHRHLEVVHDTPGRLRLRLDWLRGQTAEAEPVAEAVQALPGIARVEVRPYTGSVLCLYDPERLRPEELVALIEAQTGTRREGLQMHEISDLARAAGRDGSTLARAVARFFKTLDGDLLDWTDGTLGLPGAVAGGMLAVGLFEVLVDGELELPSWHDLLWRALRIVSAYEEEAISHTPHPFTEH